jgi:hypothetical protein
MSEELKLPFEPSETQPEYIDINQVKLLNSLIKAAEQSAPAAMKAENDQLKLRLMQLELKAAYKLSDTDTLDINTGLITRK